MYIAVYKHVSNKEKQVMEILKDYFLELKNRHAGNIQQRDPINWFNPTIY